MCNISLGTSGTVFIAQDSFSVDENNSLHSFVHANGKHHLMGCVLSAASCNKWWMENILETQEFAVEQQGLEVLLGENDVYFLPYLMGERSPHNDVDASGVFLGMRPETTRKHMTLAVMEGVAFALRDCVEIAKGNGLKIESTKICGGGAKSNTWKKIVSNVFGIPVSVMEIEEGPAYGAAILAMVGSKEYESVEQAANTLIKEKEKVLPLKELVEKYEKRYQHFRKIYPALKVVFGEVKSQ